LVSAGAAGVTFKHKDYRLDGPDRYKTMTLEPGELTRRFLMHVLPRKARPRSRANHCGP
jgi:hypothetical protein